MEHKWNQEWHREGHRVVECEICGYRHLYPLPDNTELENFYRDRYHQVKQHIAYDMVDNEFIDKKVAELQANREFKRIYRKVAALVPEDSPLTMIDIGGGNNLLSRFFMDRGWNSTVFEPNGDAANYLRRFRLHVVESMFEHSDCSQLGSYSFINLQFVLEHVLNPLDMLCQAVDMMNSGGFIRVCVPNDFSPGQLAWLTKAGAGPHWISYPDHVNYFDFVSLQCLLRRAGLVEMSRDTSFPLEFLLLTGTDYYSEKTLQKQVGAMVSGFEEAWLKSGQEDCLAALYEKLADLGLGRSAVIYAKRK